MHRLVACVLALLAARGACSYVKHEIPHPTTDPGFLQRQVDLVGLYFYVNEPLHEPEWKTIAETWKLDKNIESYKNVTALETYIELMEYDMQIPRSVPFDILEHSHQFEARLLYNLLISAKDYNTFLKTAVFLRAHVNEGLFVYVLSVAILNHPETKGIMIPPIYEIFPSYFHNAMVMHMARKVNTYGKHMVEHDPDMYMWDDNVVIQWNTTVWPFVNSANPSLAYMTHDNDMNANYYNIHLTYPFWLSEKELHLPSHRRGKFTWFTHKQLLSLYYLERLSNGQGEIPNLGLSMVPEGYDSGLIHRNGIPFPIRPDNFNLEAPEFIKHVEMIAVLEQRISDAIDLGYIISSSGEKINLWTPEGMHILGNVIEGNVDSPNLNYYGSLVTLWKELLGNSIKPHRYYYNGHVPLVVPSPLEMYQTALRDPAFYMMWKRIFALFDNLQMHLPHYSHEELGLPAVKIQRVELDKLVTYFENSYVNITNELYMNEVERKSVEDHLSVLVKHPKLNHKAFQVRAHVKSETAIKVHVKFFIAPKYDSKGIEIPLHENTENFLQIDEFIQELPAGESEIKRKSTENAYMTEKWTSGTEIYSKALSALQSKGQFGLDPTEFGRFADRIILPKGRVGGMPVWFLVYIGKYQEPQAYDWPKGVFDIEPTSRPFLANLNLGYPLDRPLYQWQVEKLSNLMLEEVQVYHKPTPEIHVPFLML